MCQTREHVCFMQTKALGMKKRDRRLQNLHKKRVEREVLVWLSDVEREKGIRCAREEVRCFCINEF